MLCQWHTPVTTTYFAEVPGEEEEDFVEWHEHEWANAQPTMGEQLGTLERVELQLVLKESRCIPE